MKAEVGIRNHALRFSCFLWVLRVTRTQAKVEVERSYDLSRCDFDTTLEVAENA